jgi:hypothetical protein
LEKRGGRQAAVSNIPLHFTSAPSNLHTHQILPAISPFFSKIDSPKTIKKLNLLTLFGHQYSKNFTKLVKNN